MNPLLVAAGVALLVLAGAIFLLPETGHSYPDLLRVSDGPLRAVLVRLGN